ncbi:MAG: hypothetical protein ACK4UU_08315 [Fimbriimonadales bacterium]
MQQPKNTQPIHIVIGQAGDQADAKEAMDPGAYAGVAAEIRDEAQTFVVAVDASGEVHRLASVCEHDRQIVAALTGTWVAQGYRVNTLVGLKDLMRALRKSSRAEKETAQPGPEKEATSLKPEQARTEDAEPVGDVANAQAAMLDW